jgi:hypothetical protein
VTAERSQAALRFASTASQPCRVESGAIRWVLTTGGNAGPGGDARVGSRSVMAEVAATCTKVSSVRGLYDCAGKAAALRPSPTPVSSRASASAASAIAAPPRSSRT